MESQAPTPERGRIEISVKGMDCIECTRHVQRALNDVPGVMSAEVYLASEKAVLHLETDSVDMQQVRHAVSDAGYTVAPDSDHLSNDTSQTNLSRQVARLTAVVFLAVLLVVVAGEWFGLFEIVTASVPFWAGLIVVVIAGFPVFRGVLRAALRRQITSHTLMTLGVIAALAVGEWVTALIVVFFMRVGDYVESFTAERARKAVKDLTVLAPQTARIVQGADEVEVPVEQVHVDDLVVVRPGEKIPVDGQVVAGRAAVDQSTITGESMPVEVGPGSQVFAATIAQFGSVRLRATHVGADTTFGRVIKMVEEAEANRGEIQRIADKFTAYYLPIVAGIAALTFAISRDPLATAAVLVVACSCSIALATPIAMLASIGAAARSGLLIKGGKFIEALAQCDVILIDKTGTVTLGRPQVADVVAINGLTDIEVLGLAASAERYSEHPLAEAIRDAAQGQGLALSEPADFETMPGLGVRARVDGRVVTVGNQRLVAAQLVPAASELVQQGKTLIYVVADSELAGLVALTDKLRPEVPQALAELRSLGFNKIELLTGDNERSAATLADALGITYRAELLPEDKIAIVKSYQDKGHTVVMVGDGVNDAPALAQADVGIAMGAAGTDVALEAAHVALMRDDWRLVPEVLQIARRTMAVVRMNLGFTAVYNVVGLGLAAFGFLPPVLAAAAQSLPDLGILANSSRLLRGVGNGNGDGSAKRK
ncbi:MAG: heavy metal translocating P-type ATPase [Candidatus Promineifilaceae bacterium]